MTVSISNQRILALWRAGWGKAAGYSSVEEYVLSIPKDFGPMKSKLGTLSLVDPRVSFEEACKLAGLTFMDRSECTDEDFGQPADRPYWLWVNVEFNPARCPVRVSLLENSMFDRGLTSIEGIALRIQEPDLSKEFPVVFPGTVYYGLSHFRDVLLPDGRFTPECMDARFEARIAYCKRPGFLKALREPREI